MLGVTLSILCLATIVVRSERSLLSTLTQLADDLLQDPTVVRREFWFLKASKTSFDMEDLLEALVGSEPIASQPKVIFDELSSPGHGLGGIPTLVFVLLEEDHRVKFGSAMTECLKEIDVQTKLVVIFIYQSDSEIKEIVKLFERVRLFNIIYIVYFKKKNQYTIINFIVYRDRIQNLQRYESVHQVFPEQIDFVGLPVTVCTTYFGLYSTLDRLSGKVEGYDVQKASIVLDQMNANVSIEFIDCDSSEDDATCLNRQIGRGNCILNFGRFHLVKAEYGVPVLPMNSIVIIVPRGMPLNVYELLAAPYSKQSWFVLTGGTITGMIVIQLFLKRPALNLLMLVVCGLEDSTLKQKKTAGRLITVGFVILSFLLISGHEAKIVSFLSSWPHKPDVTSVEDLADGQIVISPNALFVPPEILDNPMIRHLIRRKHYSSLQEMLEAVPKVGFLSEEMAARILLQKQLNIDPRSSRTKFTMLEERLDTRLMFHYFGERNAIRERFGQLLQRVVESGLAEHWMTTFAAYQSILASDLEEQLPQMIRFEQLQQLKGVFMILWSVSTMVFLMEVAVKYIENLSKILQRMLRNIKLKFLRKKPAKKIQVNKFNVYEFPRSKKPKRKTK